MEKEQYFNMVLDAIVCNLVFDCIELTDNKIIALNNLLNDLEANMDVVQNHLKNFSRTNLRDHVISLLEDGILKKDENNYLCIPNQDEIIEKIISELGDNEYPDFFGENPEDLK